ncbi:MAG TPA: SDR family oxidoreductase [Steroidobacteraceae bacterium]|nr:SDR family oxidoreductase [Steroidobacteraceae bacterium]
MSYFVTGGTGFIGRHLLGELLKRDERVYVLVRARSRARLAEIARDLGAAGQRIVAVEGDLGQRLLGIGESTLTQLRGQIRHFFHLGALYDLAAEAPELEQANVAGTRNALALAEELQAGCFHLVSSIASAGRYPGVFTEQMFGEACGLDHPYFRTKHDSEGLVRQSSRIAWRVYRPGMVVGHSETGVIDKIDGPYYLFKLLQKLRDSVPRWMPLLGFEGGHINLVPVDYVVRALNYLAHAEGLDGRCFHLTDPEDRRVGQVLNLFAQAAHAPVMALRVDSSLIASMLPKASGVSAALTPVRRIVQRLLRDLNIPAALFGLLDYPTSFDSREARALLEPAGIRVPRLEDYAWRLWDYWERQLDPGLSGGRALEAAVRNKTVLITGGSSGIGRATAIMLAAAGARVLIVARDPVKLADVRAQIEQHGGSVCTFECDLSAAEDCERFLAQLQAEHPCIDILINNAGRSIRRAVESTYQRFHDYERLMRLNYFAAVRVTLALLPGMAARGSGHVIGISSIGVLANAARFAAYNASKAALEAFMRSAAGEYRDRGVAFTVVNMPLVRTPMVAPTKIYDKRSLIQPEQAAEIVCKAIVQRPQRLLTPLGSLAQLVEAFAPQLKTAINAENFRMFPDSEAAGGPALSCAKPSAESAAFNALMHAVEW